MFFVRSLVLSLLLVVYCVGWSPATQPSERGRIDNGLVEVVVETTDGQKISGLLQNLTSDAAMLVDSAGPVGVDQISRIRFAGNVENPENNVYPCELIDGSRLLPMRVAIQNRWVTCELSNGIKLRINTRNANSIQQKSYIDDPNAAKQWREFSNRTPETGDALILNRNDTFEALQGVVGDMTNEAVEFQLGTQKAQIKRSKIEGIVFYHAAGRQLVEPICAVQLTDGSRLMARDCSLNGDQLELMLVCGERVVIGMEQLVMLDYSLGRSVLLSELDPSSMDWEPLLASTAIMPQLKKIKLPKTNASLDGGPLELQFFPEKGVAFLSQKKQFAGGFAMVGGSKMAFSLEGQYSALEGFVGFSPKASSAGVVQFVVQADGKRILEQVLKKSDFLDPIRLNLKIENVDRLVFLVEYYDGRAIGDVLHLCDVKVSK